MLKTNSVNYLQQLRRETNPWILRQFHCCWLRFSLRSPPKLFLARRSFSCAYVSQGRTISADQALFDAGLDSVSAEAFVGRLQESLLSGGWVSGEDAMKDAVSSTTVFDCPTPRHIAEHVEGILSRGGESTSAAGTTADPGASSGRG